MFEHHNKKLSIMYLANTELYCIVSVRLLCFLLHHPTLVQLED
jgi:hypothetical protein